MWRSYNGIPSITGYNFTHLKVNHQEHFTDPTSGATTNHVEAMWAAFKRRRLTNYGLNRSLLESHLLEFMWRQRYAYRFKNGTRKSSAFHNIIRHITESFPLN